MGNIFLLFDTKCTPKKLTRLLKFAGISRIIGFKWWKVAPNGAKWWISTLSTEFSTIARFFRDVHLQTPRTIMESDRNQIVPFTDEV